MTRERFVATPEQRDPRVAVVTFLGLVLLGLMAHFGVRALNERDNSRDAVRTARLYRPDPSQPTLAEAVVADAAVDPRAIQWVALPSSGFLRSVRAVAHKGARRYAYLFDVDLERGDVHPRNPRAQRAMRAFR